MNLKPTLIVAAIFFTSILLFGCGSSGTNTATPAPIAYTSFGAPLGIFNYGGTLEAEKNYRFTIEANFEAGTGVFTSFEAFEHADVITINQKNGDFWNSHPSGYHNAGFYPEIRGYFEGTNVSGRYKRYQHNTGTSGNFTGVCLDC